MRILNRLTFKSLKLNKKRTIGTIIGIILSVALICAIAGMGDSFRSSLIANCVESKGYNHLTIRNIKREELEKLELNREIKNINTTYDLGYAKFKNEREDIEPYIHIYSLGKTELKDIGAKLVEGRMPKSSSEIVVSETAFRNGKLNLDDIITFEVGRRKSNDDFDLDDSNPYNEGLEKLTDIKKKTYRIVGVFKGFDYYYNYVAYTINEEQDNYINAYIALKNPFKEEKVIKDILELGDFKDYTKNTELLRWEAFSFSDTTITSLVTVLGIVIFIVVVTSVYCIRNSFAISTTEKIKMYGMLASIGATKKQIRSCVVKEGLMLSLIGIPLGILSGILADFVLIKVINLIAGEFLFSGGDSYLVFSINWVPVVISIVLGLVTIYLSSMSSARKASKVSPIQNLRNSDEVKIKSKKLRTPKIIHTLFKTGGVLAYKNLKRSKKKYRTTVISLTISIFVFITMNSFINEGFKTAGTYYTDYNYNIKLNGLAEFTKEDIDNVKNLSHYNLFALNYETTHTLNVPLDNVNKKMIDTELYNDNCEYNEAIKDVECQKLESIGIQIVALDHDTYLDYLKKIKVKSNNAKNKGILVDDYLLYDDNGASTLTRIYGYQKGDTIKGELNDKDFSIDIADISNKRPMGMENMYYTGGFIVVDYNDFSSLEYMLDAIIIDTDNHVDVTEKIEKMYPTISLYDIDEAAKAERAIVLIISIFLYGFIAVITLIGVTNIFNTITSNMELRQKEFAMLKSIGMTKKEFNRMINLETLFYSTKSLLYGIILGIIGSYFIHNAFGLRMMTKFNLPTNAIIISIVFVFFLVYVIMRYSISKINKQNIIETIRKDNI